MIRAAISLALLVSLTAASALAAPRTFNEAKKIAWKIYAEAPYDIYCGCPYQGNRFDLEACGYTPRKQPRRAERVEWEHIVPAWVIGHQRQCWQSGGRGNCSRNDPIFSAAEADLHNLAPSVGEVNGDRSNFRFGMLETKPHQYGTCSMVVDFKQRMAMPPENIRGMVARTYLYMRDRYKLRLSDKETKLYSAWHKQYPVNQYERWRNHRTTCAMGWSNTYVEDVPLTSCSKVASR